MAKLKGIIWVLLLVFISMLGIMFSVVPLIPFLYFRPRAVRKVWDTLISWGMVYTVAAFEKLSGIKIKITGSPMPRDHSGLIILNHRTRLEWIYMMLYQMRCGPIERTKIIIKDGPQYIPGPGWVMQCAGYIFLKRKWDADKTIIQQCISYFSNIGLKSQVIIFPEGTDFTERTRARSDKFAEKNNLQKYDYTLHPRTTGFVFLVEKMRERDMLQSVLDVTVGYPQNVAQTEIDIAKGNFPAELHFHARNHNNKDIPQDREALEEWLKDVWYKKEETLKTYYTGEKTFDSGQSKMCRSESEVQSLYRKALIFWGIFQTFAIILLIYSPLARLYALLCAIGFAFLGRYGGLGNFLASSSVGL